jgi:hypothetical protein
VFELTDAERTLLELTEQQYALLDTLARHTRVAIAGCAGSGRRSSPQRRLSAWRRADFASSSSASTSCSRRRHDPGTRPAGLPVDTHFYADDKELLAQLDASVRAWREDAEVPPEQIALLTPRSSERSILWTVDRLGGVRLTDDPWETGTVLRSSIGRFKGLERLVVAIAELDGARDEALYIGFSRASTFLSIFCSKDARRRLPGELVARSANAR